MFDYYDPNDRCRALNADVNAPRMPQMQLAQAYVPFQPFNETFPPDKALTHGTIFPELFMPYKKRIN